MRSYILTGAALLLCAVAQAQPSLVNSAGGSGVIGGNTFEWSVGEAIIATTSTPGLVVTQGLLQPLPPGVSVNNTRMANDEIRLYPNPASDVLVLQSNLSAGGDIQYQLLDITGRIMLRGAARLAQGNEKQYIHIEALPAGSYIMQVQVSGSAGALRAAYNVQKLK